MAHASSPRSSVGRDVAALTAAVRAGDPAALEALYVARFDWVLAVVRRRSGGDESFCLDAVQEVFLRVVRSLPVIEHESALEAWLAKTAESCVRDVRRSDARRARREAAHDAMRRSASSPSSATDVGHVGDEAPAADMAPHIAKLPPQDIELITARYRFGWTLAKIGAVLGVGAGAVDGRLSRVMARLRKEIDDERG